MTSELPLHLPDALIQELRQVPDQFTAIPVLTVDRSGFPHVALLSWFEVFEKHGRLRFLLASPSRSALFARTRAVTTLMFVSSAFVLYVKGKASFVGEMSGQSLFELELVQVLEDRPTHEEASVYLSSGIQFHLPAADVERRVARRKQFSEWA